jgi:hypothetical protein
MIRSSLLLAALVALISLSGCNLYGGLDGPSGDAQILSAARAAFDQGDYQLAIQLYGELSSANADVGLSETAYADLTQAGASMQAYAAAFGKGDVAIGPAITSFAEGILAKGSGETTRVAIWQAFNLQKNIQNPNLKALVRFLGSLSFAAEILAETSSDGKRIMKTDLSNGKVNISATPFPSSGNGNALGGTFPASTSAATLTDVSVTTPTYNMFNAALTEIILDIAVLGDSGTFGASTLSFAQQLSGSNFPTNPALTSTYASLLSTPPVSIGE